MLRFHSNWGSLKAVRVPLFQQNNLTAQRYGLLILTKESEISSCHSFLLFPAIFICIYNFRKTFCTAHVQCHPEPERITVYDSRQTANGRQS